MNMLLLGLKGSDLNHWSIVRIPGGRENRVGQIFESREIKGGFRCWTATGSILDILPHVREALHRHANCNYSISMGGSSSVVERQLPKVDNHIVFNNLIQS